MRMRINRVRFTVRRPTGVRDADATRRVLVRSERFQFRHFAFGFVNIELSLLVDQCHAGTVVPAVLQTMQALNQNRIGLAFTYVTNYTTHSVYY